MLPHLANQTGVIPMELGDIALFHDQGLIERAQLVLETGVERAFGEAGYWWRTQSVGDVISQLDWERTAGLHDERVHLLARDLELTPIPRVATSVLAQ
jgi:hypothetical protein